ncbi:Antirestriction protein [Lysobacter capsici AZ78]|uniref:Antirestriction protein n=1 Tax=Lysobacter capsici AZ78 TaxID=1444315 RepID=A0A108U743_9GAMM|nr:antirestriction protein ArdA [Lysobacter capsici]KWS03767.1 Antirestriction protein [Lysobacter capsici AZ78]
MRSIYVACLASYNAGTLHGDWIDLEILDLEEAREEIAQILRESPHPNVTVTCPKCSGTGEWITMRHANGFEDKDPAGCQTCKGVGMVPSAAEWAVHDYDGLPSSFGEHPDLDELAAYVEAVDEHGDAFVAYFGNESHADVASAVEGFSDAYSGEFRNAEEWAEGFLDDTGAFQGVSDTLRNYFDFQAYARDARLGGDMTFLDNDNGGVYAFSH